MERTRIKYLKQSITITGLGGESFENICKVSERMSTFFKRYGKLEGSLEEDARVYCGTYSALEFNNRYLTPKYETDGSDILNIPTPVDPTGALAAVCGDHHVYTSENEVVYMKEINTDGKLR